MRYYHHEVGYITEMLVTGSIIYKLPKTQDSIYFPVLYYTHSPYIPHSHYQIVKFHSFVYQGKKYIYRIVGIIFAAFQ